MKIRSYVKKFLAVMLLTCSLAMPRSVQAIVWPAVAPTETGLFINNIISAVSTVAAGNAQIQGYIATIQAIGDQVSMAAKYAQDIGVAINSIEDNVEELDGVTREANAALFNTMNITVDGLSEANNENSQMVSNLVSAVENATL